jgi:hypothetical protein
LELGGGEERLFCLVGASGNRVDAGVTMGTLRGATTGAGVTNTLGGARWIGEIGTATGGTLSTMDCSGAEGSGAIARPRMSATFAKALIMGGPKARGVAVREAAGAFRRCNMSAAFCLSESS